MARRKETHVSEEKKQKVRDLAELMKKKTVMIVSVKGLPSAQFQDIKKKLRGRAKVQVAKKSLVDFALEHSGIKELHELVPYVEENTAILFSDNDAFEISGILASEKSPAKAKEGQEASEDIEVKAGATNLLPGPDISILSSAGLTPKVEGGKIHILRDFVLVKRGEVINAKKASIMAKLDIIPFKVGIEPVAAYMDGKVYTGIKIDKEEALKELQKSFGQAMAFSVEIGYICSDNLIFVLQKVVAYENAINSLIKEEVVEKKSQATELPNSSKQSEDSSTKEQTQETKTEEIK